MYGPPFEDAGVRSKARIPIIAQRRPCVWINIVGKDSIWPVRTVSIGDLETRAAKLLNQPIINTAAKTSGSLELIGDANDLLAELQERSSGSMCDLRCAAASLAQKAKSCLETKAIDKSPSSWKPDRAEEDREINKELTRTKNRESQRRRLIKKAADLGATQARRLLQGDGVLLCDYQQYVDDLSSALDQFIKTYSESDTTKATDKRSPSPERADVEFRDLFDFQTRVALLKSLLPDGNLATSLSGKALARLENDIQIFWFIRAQAESPVNGKLADANSSSPLIIAQRSQCARHLLALWRHRQKLETLMKSSRSKVSTSLDRKQAIAESQFDDGRANALSLVMDAVYSQHIALLDLIEHLSNPGPQGPHGSSQSDDEPDTAQLWQACRTQSLALDHSLNCLENLQQQRRIELKMPLPGSKGEPPDERALATDIVDLRRTLTGVTRTLIELKGDYNKASKGDDAELWFRARVAQLEKQANDSGALIPAVIDIDREYDDIAREATGKEDPMTRRDDSAREGSGSEDATANREKIIVAFTELVPLTYSGVMIVWMCLAASLIYRVLQTNTGVQLDQRGSFDAFCMTAGGRSRFLIILIALALVYGTTLAVARPLLIVALHCFTSLWSPSVLWTGFGGTLFCMILFFSFVALASGWLVYKRCRLELMVAGASIGVRRAVCASMVLGWLIMFIGPPLICLAFPQSIHQEMLTANRTLHLGNGVSPVLTILFLGGLLLLWCLFRLDFVATCQRLPAPSQGLKARADLVWPDEAARQSPWVRTVRHALRQFDELCWVERHSPVIPFPEPAVAAVNQRAGVGKLLAGVVQMPVIPIAVIMAVGLAVVAAGSSFGFPVRHFRGRFTPTPEGPLFDTCVVLALLLYLTIYLLMFFRLALIWWKLRDLLVALDSLPWGASLARMPAKVSSLFGRFMGLKSHPRSSGDAPDPTDVIELRYAQAVAVGLTVNEKLCDQELATPVTRHLATINRVAPNGNALIQTIEPPRTWGDISE